MGVATHRPSSVTLVFNGIPISGFMDGTYVALTKNTDAFALKMGATGTGARAQTQDESGTCVFTLLQTSEVNAALTAMHKLDKNAGDGVGPLACKDLSGADTASAETAWIRKVADVEYSNEIMGREWTIETDNLDLSPGGNPI
ncbi:hypothetical protein LCGC14_1463410 [marine sediment metagenome]|uniref:DUF3277 family protein n=1 Tax=marine sediment metagenome TaxID=412755 RepID=A0A0F9K0F1_9ZZZZ